MQFSNEHQLIKEAAEQFANQHLVNNSEHWAQAGALPESLFHDLGAQGFMGILLPDSFGGANLDYQAYALILEGLAYGDAACSTLVSVHNSVGTLPIYHYGTHEQQSLFLPGCASGKQIAGFALSEPQAGSDAAAIKTKAEKVGNEYIINGAKQFITAGKSAHLMIVIATLDDHHHTAFIVPTNTPGYIVDKVEKKMGQEAAETVALRFENCRVPESYRLGEEGQGLKIALSQLEAGRIGIASQALGIASRAFDCANQYAKERHTFGQSLNEHQHIAFLLAEMATRLEAIRSLIWRTAVAKDAGQPVKQLAAMAKLFASENAEWICRQAIQIHGGYGYLQDFPVERLYRDVRVTSIYEGTSEVQKMIIARSLSEHA
ncbi:MAG: acyl-CoA dehydrogenase [Legionellales bacterium]|nr:acyl-CoA dehydrogenase [Legionellales bacterium]|tara:strand:+ start:1326 stop:2453 length:1128 start_codon:yes stop_codon:yes gene_type:complete